VDEHVPRALSAALRLHNVDLLTVQEDDRRATDDAVLLDRAMGLGRVVLTQDKDFLAIARRWQEDGKAFAGVIFMRQGVALGRAVEDLILVATLLEPADMADQVRYVPL
jgi:predicted nuclease of predicted toxin-antitoxin system